MTPPSSTSSGTAAPTPSRPQPPPPPRRPPRPPGMPAARTRTTTPWTSPLPPAHPAQRPLVVRPEPPGDPVAATIAEIQGTGSTSPFSGKRVTTSGVVTAAYPTGGFNGFYLQTAGTGGEVDPATHQASDAVFVFGSAATGVVQRGDHVEVTGKVTEFAGTTEITAGAADVKVLADPASVSPRASYFPGRRPRASRSRGCCSRLAGRTPSPNNYSLNQYAEIGLAAGRTPLFAPTEVADPHDAAAIAAVEGGQRRAFGDPRRRRHHELLHHCQEHPAALPHPGPPDPGRGSGEVRGAGRARVALRQVAVPADRPADRGRGTPGDVRSHADARTDSPPVAT